MLEGGNGGWIRLSGYDELPGDLYVRVAPDEEGRWRIRDLFLQGDREPIDGSHLRAIPVGVIEAQASRAAPIHGERLNVPAPDLRTLISYFATTPDDTEPDHWVKKAFAAQVPGSGEPQVGPAKRKARRLRRVGERARRPLEVPPSRPYPDSFYREVAASYGRLLEDGAKPAPVLAAETGVPLTTAHRWIKEARRRGFLAPTRKGRAAL